MSATPFDTAFDRTVGLEKGYVNNSKDPGGETNWGISKREYPHIDIRELTREGAKAIYLRDFWNPLDVGGMHVGLQYQLFDFAVNSGIGNAIRALQHSVGVAPDGHWGPVSTKALEAQSDTDTLFLFLAERLEFMAKLKNWDDAGRGWVNRIASDLRYAAQDS